VRDRLAACGWQVEIADARKVKAIAPLACKTDRVDARVLAELVRRDLVPEVWVPSLDDRALRERLRRRSHLVRLRTSATNRTFGLLTQWGLRHNLTALRKPGALEQLAEHGVPAVWRQSIATLLGVIDDLDRQLAPLERELRPLARADERVQLLMTIHGVAELLGLTLAAEIGDIARFFVGAQAGRLFGAGADGQAVRPKRAHRQALQGRAQHAALGRRRGRPAGLAADQPLAPALHRRQAPPRQVQPGQGRRRAQGLDRRLARALPRRAV
jgi:transposase